MPVRRKLTGLAMALATGAFAACGQAPGPGEWSTGKGPGTAPPAPTTQGAPTGPGGGGGAPLQGGARPPVSPAPARFDVFGVREIYPTVQGGREWAVDMSDPTSDPDFVFSSANSATLVKNADGSWRDNEVTHTTSEGARLQVVTAANETPWKNVEISGYVRLISTPDTTERFSWYGRSGQHTDTDPCDGTAYHMQLGYDGSVWYQKEVWHTGGYTPDRRGQLSGVVAAMKNQWVGFKAMIYNVDADAHVANEIWVDPVASDRWVKVNAIVDTGGWSGSQPGCQRPLDAILSTSRPIVAFRADNALYDFKWLTVREIVVPAN